MSAIEKIEVQRPPRTRLLTDIDHVDIHGVGEGAAHSVGGHHGDVVVDPDGRVVLVEEARVLPAREVVGALVHDFGAGDRRSGWEGSTG